MALQCVSKSDELEGSATSIRRYRCPCRSRRVSLWDRRLLSQPRSIQKSWWLASCQLSTLLGLMCTRTSSRCLINKPWIHSQSRPWRARMQAPSTIAMGRRVWWSWVLRAVTVQRIGLSFTRAWTLRNARLWIVQARFDIDHRHQMTFSLSTMQPPASKRSRSKSMSSTTLVAPN